MPQNSKDSQGGKTHSGQEKTPQGGTSNGQGKADHKNDSPTGSHNKGEKKTTP